MSDIALRELLTMALERVPINDQQEYATAGILSYGRGLFKRPVVLGQDTQYSAYYRLRAGQFVYSKLFAWEGAVAVVPPEFDGMFVSQEFPTFDINTSVILPEYLGELCKWPPFWERMRAGESGMGGRRKRVQPARLLTVVVPVPPLEEQARIADVLYWTEQCASTYKRTHGAAALVARALRQEHFANLDAEPSYRAGEIFDVTIGRQRAPRYAVGENMVRYLRAANVKDGFLDLSDVKHMNFDPLEQLKFRLDPGDVLVTEGSGSLKQLGASAQWAGDLAGVVCFQNTLIRLRGRSGQSLSSYAYHWARRCFEEGRFAAIASGTNIYHLGMERLASLPVTPIPLEEQAEFVKRVETADAVVANARAAGASLTTLTTALRSELILGLRQSPGTVDQQRAGA